MSKKIYKYLLNAGGLVSIYLSIPVGGIVRYVGKQDNIIHAWVEVDPSAVTEMRCFMVVGTGNYIQAPSGHYPRYANSVVMDNGDVWHVYEAVPKSVTTGVPKFVNPAPPDQ